MANSDDRGRKRRGETTSVGSVHRVLLSVGGQRCPVRHSLRPSGDYVDDKGHTIFEPWPALSTKALVTRLDSSRDGSETHRRRLVVPAGQVYSA